NIRADGFQDVGQISCSHHRIVGAPDFRQPQLPWLGCPLIEPDERKSALVHIRLAKARSSEERQASRIVPARSLPNCLSGTDTNNLSAVTPGGASASVQRRACRGEYP